MLIWRDWATSFELAWISIRTFATASLQWVSSVLWLFLKSTATLARALRRAGIDRNRYKEGYIATNIRRKPNQAFRRTCLGGHGSLHIEIIMTLAVPSLRIGLFVVRVLRIGFFVELATSRTYAHEPGTEAVANRLGIALLADCWLISREWLGLGRWRKRLEVWAFQTLMSGLPLPGTGRSEDSRFTSIPRLLPDGWGIY